MEYTITTTYYDDVISECGCNRYAQSTTTYPSYKAAVKAYYDWWDDPDNGSDPSRKTPDFPILLDDRIRHDDVEYYVMERYGEKWIKRTYNFRCDAFKEHQNNLRIRRTMLGKYLATKDRMWLDAAREYESHLYYC